MNVLGVSCYFHDSAAALVCDGRVVAAAAEERFTRVKHDSSFPAHAIRFCLDRWGLVPAELDAVVFYEKPLVKLDRILSDLIAAFPSSLPSFVKAVPVWTGKKLHIGRQLSEALFSGAPIMYEDHHESHAACAFLASPFDRAAILTADGVGEWATTCCGVGEGDSVRLESEIRYPHSLGLFYSAITDYLGFRVNSGEWKVMALAAYGTPRFADAMRTLIEIDPEGAFRLNMRYFNHDRNPETLFSPAVERLFGFPPRGAGEIGEAHCDLACSAQQALEEALLAILRRLHRTYGGENLCLSGGVALNSVANGRVLRESPFRHVFVPSAPGDDGGSVGAALHACARLSKGLRRSNCDPYLGPAYSNREIGEMLSSHGSAFTFQTEPELLDMAARSLAAGRVIGWFQGAMEFGPRALGNRSILAHPGLPGIKHRINSAIKQREHFRPLAPAILAERATEYFDFSASSPYMSFVAKAKPGISASISEALHCDSSARLETVDRGMNPLFHALLARFEALTGLPVLINTSFNVNGEPIVCSPSDALRTAQSAGLDELYLGSHRIELASEAPALTDRKEKLCLGGTF
jgi:carbamoyltransferase